MKILSLASALALFAALISSGASAQTLQVGASDRDLAVSDAYVRATVPQQKATGVFMQLRSTAGARLVAVKTPVAGAAEVHEMKMSGDVMRMRQIESLPLPAGEIVALAPGGYHVMLLQLTRQLKAGDTVPLTLTVENAAKQRSQVQVEAVVRPIGAPSIGASGVTGAAANGHVHDGSASTNTAATKSK